MFARNMYGPIIGNYEDFALDKATHNQHHFTICKKN